MEKLPDHLGGHLNKTHTDRGTLLYLKQKYNIKSSIDIGCGPGAMVQIANDRGIDAWGIDGDFTLTYPTDIENKIIMHDFTTGKPKIDREFDILCVQLLLLEHLDIIM